MGVLFNIAVSFVTVQIFCILLFNGLFKKLDELEANCREELLETAIKEAVHSKCCECDKN